MNNNTNDTSKVNYGTPNVDKEPIILLNDNKFANQTVAVIAAITFSFGIVGGLIAENQGDYLNDPTLTNEYSTSKDANQIFQTVSNNSNEVVLSERFLEKDNICEQSIRKNSAISGNYVLKPKYIFTPNSFKPNEQRIEYTLYNLETSSGTPSNDSTISATFGAIRLICKVNGLTGSVDVGYISPL